MPRSLPGPLWALALLLVLSGLACVGPFGGPKHSLQILSVDTMKFSRDPSRELWTDPQRDKIIETHIANVASTNATHVAIDTPYDDEFVPILRQWVAAARKHKLKVWFRGNLSGWEGWFGYPPIDRPTHLAGIERFILGNPDLFEDGDLFSSCPECENGGPGDPRTTGDVAGHRRFLIDQYAVTRQAFGRLGKQVRSNFNSMNGDVAALIMDKDTTAALDGIVVVDHYVPTTEGTIKDLAHLARQSGGRVVLGEFGAPLPGVHKAMSAEEQAEWIGQLLARIGEEPSVIGLNYWVHAGGPTELWNKDGSPRPAATVIARHYRDYRPRGSR
jgi:hypothetical protein